MYINNPELDYPTKPRIWTQAQAGSQAQRALWALSIRHFDEIYRTSQCNR